MPAIVLLIVLIVLFLLVLAAGLYFATLVVFPRTMSVQKTFQVEVESGKLVEAEYNAWPRQEVHIRSPYGYDLFGIYIPLTGSRKTVVIAHGITFSVYGSVKYAALFRRAGYNVLLYDHRNHGRSGGKNTTFGYYEKHDLQACCDWAWAQLGPGGTIGTMGESMGAAICLQHAALDPRVAFVVADCPFSDLETLLQYRLRQEYHLPSFPLLHLASLFSRLLTGMSFGQISPIRDIATLPTPILFMHGAEDDYIPPHMSQDLYDTKQVGIKDIYLAPGAAHAEALWSDREAYEKKLGQFLAEVEAAWPSSAKL